MHPTFPESSATFLVLAGVALYVAFRRERNGVHWLLLTLLGAMMVWNGGLACFYYFESGEVARAAITAAFLGVFTVPPCWLLLAARHTHVRLFDERPGWLIAVLVPPAMTALAVVTNSGHRLFVRDLTAAGMQGPATHWAGPIFWIGLGFGILLMLVGTTFYLGAAWQMIRNGQTSRGLVLGSIVSFPVVAGPLISLYTQRDVTPMLLGAMTILLFAVNWRHRVLETLPIARRDVIEQLPEAVILADSDGFVLDVNPAAEKIIGSPAASLRRQSLELLLADLATDRDRQEVERAARALLSCGQTARVEFEAVDDRALELNASAVGSGDGETAGFYALLRDRTEHLRYERFQRQSHRLEIVASLTQGIAYEVNNPLAFVRSNLNHIHRTCGQLAIELRDAPGGKREELEELRQVAEESLEGLQRIEETVGRMRRFSLLHERELTVVDLNAVVNDAVRMGQFHSSPELRVRRELCVVTLPVKGSAEHLVQAVLNLVVNARQALAGRHDGLLRVSTRRTGDGVEVRVADNGPGISEEMQQRIFDPDYAAQGFGPDGGLGLAIAFGIIQEHNGMLDLESSSSLGTEFVIRLPVATGATITAGGGPDPAA